MYLIVFIETSHFCFSFVTKHYALAYRAYSVATASERAAVCYVKKKRVKYDLFYRPDNRAPMIFSKRVQIYERNVLRT